MGNTSSQLALLNVSIFIISVIAFIYFAKKDKRKRSGKEAWIQRRKLHNRYVLYNNNIFLRKRFRRVVTQYSSLACYNFDKVKEESVKLFERSLGVAVSLPIVSMVLLQNVILSALIGVIGYLYYDIVIDREIDKVYFEIMQEISNNIQSIRERYMETDNITKAILLSDKGKLLDQPIMKIYEMLTDIQGEEILYDFCRTSPIRMLKTLATTCFIVNEYGDERKENGESTFAEELMSLRQEVDCDLRGLQKTRVAFKSLSTLALIGILCTPAVDLFLLKQIPGTSLLVKGMYGMIEKALLIGVTILAYYVISVINRHSVVNQIDKIEWIDNLAKKKKVKDWIQNVIPKKYKTRYKLNKLVQESISSKDMNYIYLTKTIFAVVSFLGTILFLFCFIITAKSYLWNNYKTLSFIPDGAGMEERVYKQIKVLDQEYMTQPEKLTDDETYKLVKGKVRGLKELEYQNQVQRLSTKWDKYYSLSFRWYFILIAYAFGILGWYMPQLSLFFRRMLVKYEEAEDILQLQTMMIVLANTKMDVFKALYWLEKQSSVHKAPLRFAYHEFTSDPEGALDRLSASTGSIDLKRLVAKLKSAVYSVSIHDAFSDMLLSKEHSLRTREILQDESRESKKQIAKMLASTPLSLMLLGGFVGPILLLGITELTRTFGQLGGI